MMQSVMSAELLLNDKLKNINLSVFKYSFAVFWQIKLIHVEEKYRKDEKKFDKIIDAIRKNKSKPGYSKIIWMVRR